MAVCDPGRTLTSRFQPSFANCELNHNLCEHARHGYSSVEDKDVKRLHRTRIVWNSSIQSIVS